MIHLKHNKNNRIIIIQDSKYVRDTLTTCSLGQGRTHEGKLHRYVIKPHPQVIPNVTIPQY